MSRCASSGTRRAEAREPARVLQGELPKEGRVIGERGCEIGEGAAREEIGERLPVALRLGASLEIGELRANALTVCERRRPADARRKCRRRDRLILHALAPRRRCAACRRRYDLCKAGSTPASARRGSSRRRGEATSGSSSIARRPGTLSSSRSTPPCRRATAAARLRPRPNPGRERALSSRTKRSSHAPAIALRNARARGRRPR